MSIASEITRLQGVKTDILTAIADKGVTVPAGSALDDCPGLIAAISGSSPVIPQTLVNKTIFGQQYQCVEIASGVFFPIRNLIFHDENIELISSREQLGSTPQCFYYNYDSQYSYLGLYYNIQALNYLNGIKETTYKDFTSTHLGNLYSYIKPKVQAWIDSSAVGNKLATFVVKDKNGFQNALSALDLGFFANGYSQSGKFPASYWCGFGTKSNDNFVRISSDDAAIEVVSGNTGWDDGYQFGIRYIIDEN